MSAADIQINGFDDREFSVLELSDVMNIIPNRYGLVTQLGIFPDPVPIATTYVSVQRQNWTLNLLPATPRGGPGTKGTVARRDRKLFEVPQITHEDAVSVADVQNLRAFGSYAPKRLEDLIREKLATMVNKHALTHEWYRIKALQGQILDADGSTMLDYFTEFGVTRPVAAFGAASSKQALLRKVKLYVEKSLRGETMSRIMCLASPSFMEMLFADSDIKQAHNLAMAAHSNFVMTNPTLHDMRFSFVHQEIEFVQYAGAATSVAADGTSTILPFIPDGDAVFFPLGTMESARQYAAPGDFEESHNMPGRLFYAKEERGRYGRTREILTQSNLLVMWRRPELLVRGTTGNSGDNLDSLLATRV